MGGTHIRTSILRDLIHRCQSFSAVIDITAIATVIVKKDCYVVDSVHGATDVVGWLLHHEITSLYV